MTRNALISEIDAFATEVGLAPATVTSRAVGNSRLYARLCAGGDCTTEIAGRIRAFIAAQRASRAAQNLPTPEEDAA